MAKKQETVNGEVIDIKKWANPKIKVRRVYKIEEDGSKTKAHVIERSGIAKFHSEDGPALVNGKQKRKEYYLNGIEYTFDNWNEIMKSKEGLPWYKTSMGTGTSRH
tara:strand:+ start:319 stop:636 length:318 start_codon:yes stop_codon:yes gene_type:complete